MKTNDLLYLGIGFFLVVIFLTGCSQNPTEKVFSPTPPSPTISATPTENQPTGSDVLVTTDRSVFLAGEFVEIRVINNLDTPIWYANNTECGASFWLLESCDGKGVIYYPPCIWSEPDYDFATHASGGILEYQWDGMVREMSAPEEPRVADPGCYRILFPYLMDEVQPYEWYEGRINVYSDDFMFE